MIETTVKVPYWNYHWSEKKFDYIKTKGVYELPVVKATVREVYEAMEKNGFVHLRETWFDYTPSGGTVIGGCLLGQAAINLNVAPTVDIIDTDASKIGAGDYSEFLRAIGEFTLEKQLNKFINQNAKWANVHRGDEGIGTLMIRWNDKGHSTFDENGDFVRFVYDLPTYQDVLGMAKEVMKPFFNRKVTVAQHLFHVGK